MKKAKGLIGQCDLQEQFNCDMTADELLLFFRTLLRCDLTSPILGLSPSSVNYWRQCLQCGAFFSRCLAEGGRSEDYFKASVWAHSFTHRYHHIGTAYDMKALSMLSISMQGKTNKNGRCTLKGCLPHINPLRCGIFWNGLLLAFNFKVSMPSFLNVTLSPNL